MHVPRTPKRSKSITVTSPYFADRNATCMREQSPVEDNMENPSVEEAINLEDPLFCYYFRNFYRSYSRLALLKPKLIQGINDFSAPYREYGYLINYAESVAHDPWKLLIAVTLLNKTSGRLAIPVFWTIIARWPTPWALSHADPAELQALLKPLGTYNIRSARLIKLSEIYLRDPPRVPDLRPSTPSVKFSSDLTDTATTRRERYPPTPISHLPGAGTYALDSYRIFCTTDHSSSSDEWKAVVPTDKELIRYLRWKWAFVERKEWTPEIGAIRPATITYLDTLISDLEHNLT